MLKQLFSILAIAAMFAFAPITSADFINDGDYQGVGSRVGLDTPQDPEDCDPQTEVHDGDVCVPASGDGGGDGDGGGGDAGAGDAGPGPGSGDSGDSGGEGDGGEGDSGDSGGEGDGEGGDGPNGHPY